MRAARPGVARTPSTRVPRRFYSLLAAGATARLLPSWCGTMNFPDCARALMAEKPEDFRSNVALFRRKAELVATMNDFLDRLEEPRRRPA